MDTAQVVAALVDPNNGVIVKLIDRLGKLESEKATVANMVGEQARDIDALDDRTNRLEQGTGQRIVALEQRLDEIAGQLSETIQRIEEVRTAFAQLEKMDTPKPKRTRAKKVEPAPEPEVPQVEAEVIDPEAPAYEPGLIPDEIAGVKLTGPVVLSIRNNIKVLTLALAKQLNTEYPGELYDFVAGLTDDEAAAIAEKFPG